MASGLQNRARAAALMDLLRACGHSVTYDWTRHGDVRDRGEDVMRRTASYEVQGVADAELVILLLPGGKGTHTELGVALSTLSNKQIWLWSEDGHELQGGADTCVFYHHPAIRRIHCPFEALLSQIQAL